MKKKGEKDALNQKIKIKKLSRLQSQASKLKHKA
jgi:hypothetical protein